MNIVEVLYLLISCKMMYNRIASKRTGGGKPTDEHSWPREGKGNCHDGCHVLGVFRHRVPCDAGDDRVRFSIDLEREEGKGPLEGSSG